MSKAPIFSGKEMDYLSHFPLLLHFNFVSFKIMQCLLARLQRSISSFKLTWMFLLHSNYLFLTLKSVSQIREINTVLPANKEGLKYSIAKEDKNSPRDYSIILFQTYLNWSLCAP